MKNIPDDLFRSKLEHMQTPPPAQAWEKIEKGMRRKRITPWLAIAASLLLAVTASALILTRQTSPEPPAIANRQLPETKTTPDTPVGEEVIPPVEDTTDTRIATEPVPPVEEVEEVTEAPDASRHIPEEAVASNTTHPEPDPTSDKEDTAADDVLPETTDSIPTLVASTSEDDQTSVKIVFEAEDVQARYLKKKTRDDATDGVAKASGLRKLLDKADEIQNQNPIGDLRQMKNEILALNFQGKKRDQNK